ncbi:MAG: PAS domain S-box protein [bacterium]|nr:PAS domain S-box protein [bacterium]
MSEARDCRDSGSSPRAGDASYRTLFEDATDGLLVADVETGRFVLANPRICIMLGYTCEELLQLSVADIHPADWLERARNNFAQQVDGKLELVTEVPVRRRDGSVFRADINSRLTRFDGRPCLLGIFRNATERLEAERALRYSESKLRQSQRLARLGHYELDAATGEWEGSEALDELFGIDASFAKTVEGWVALVHPDDREGMTRYFQERVLGAGEAFDREYRIVRPRDGAVRRVHGVGELEFNSDGRAARMFGVIQDITERRLAEEERQRFEMQVQQTQKLESLGLLAGGIAHDFNNLLFGITGNADLALADIPETSPAHECLLAIIQAGQRAADLCRQLLAYTGKSRIEVSRLDLHALIGDTEKMVALAIPKSVVLRRNFASDLPAIEADATQISQVVMNLVINAAESLGERSGLVTLTTGTMECDRAQLDLARADARAPVGPYVYLEVADNGSGMDESTVARMFEPFYSTKLAGRGLGLAAVLGIVRGHLGGITVESAPGAGTRIRVLLPASEGPPALDSTPSGAAPVWRGSGTVLVVDDEDTVRLVAQRFLERMGFSVVTAGDGAEAIEILRRSAAAGHEKFACVLLDLTMPGLDGAETLTRIHALGLETPVLLSSGYDEHDLALRFEGAGVTGFVQKPYRMVDLAAKLRAAIEG